MATRSTSEASSDLVARAALAVILRRRAVLAVWAALLLASSLVAPRLLELVEERGDPEPDTPSGVARAALSRRFPGLVDQAEESVLFLLRDGVPHWQADPVLALAAQSVDEIVLRVNGDHSGAIVETRSWREVESGGEPGLSFVSRDRRSWLMQVQWRPPSPGRSSRTGASDSAADDFLREVAKLNGTYAHQGVEVVATGPHALRRVSQAQARRDVGMHALMFLPVALLLIHVHVRSWPLLLLPPLCALVSLVVAFALGSLAASLITMDTNVPTLMAFLSISLCVDWSFFLIARFQEESSRGVSPRDAAVAVALTRTGANILISGVLIIVCSLCMLGMPSGLASNAIGGSITVISSLSCCLTLLPACLSSACGSGSGSGSAGSSQGLAVAAAAGGDGAELESLFELGTSSGARGNAREPSSAADAVVAAVVAAEVARQEADRAAALGVEAAGPQPTSLWYAWAKVVTTFPGNALVLAVCCAAAVPALKTLMACTPAVDDALLYPQADPVVMASATLHSQFVGKLQTKSQMLVLLEAPGGDGCQDGVRSEGYFEASCGVASELLTLGKPPDHLLQAVNLMGVSFYRVLNESVNKLACIPWEIQYADVAEAYSALQHGNVSAKFLLTGELIGQTHVSGVGLSAYHEMYRTLWKRCVSKDGKASLIVVRLPWDLMSWSGFDMIKDLRVLLSKGREQNNDDAGLGSRSCGNLVGHEISAPSAWFDYMTLSMSSLPWVVMKACLASAVLIGMVFGSLGAPLKVLATVVLPMIWAYGLAVSCYQDGLLDSVPLASPVHSSGGLYWMVPCSTSMLLLALAMDFNIFYLGRVFEFRRAGLSDLEAIRRALASTGPVVTLAGVIFAVEFTGLLFSETVVNRQAGFVVVVSILLDAFIVRGCLMPAVLSIAANKNWWPAEMPDVRAPARLF
eukprot:TRINITY_DN19386_c0_g3_i1.p1 TRINITY_DN19386_c0_g3~~TRINITY_DN19386_c0_g3_i1.p1  ORF type:complete len:1003 (-),score=173.92 TRINITY_DN19386_c0_g3_i1:17-2779(-)